MSWQLASPWAVGFDAREKKAQMGSICRCVELLLQKHASRYDKHENHKQRIAYLTDKVTCLNKRLEMIVYETRIKYGD